MNEIIIIRLLSSYQNITYQIILNIICIAENYDDGLKANSDDQSEFAAAAAASVESSLPSISDMVTCYPSMPGMIYI